MLTQAQRRRVASARLDVPIAARASAGSLVVLGTALLGFAFAAQPPTRSIEVMIVRALPALPIAALTCLGMSRLARAHWAPLIAALGRLLEDPEASGAGSERSGSLGALGVLTPAEQRDLRSLVATARAAPMAGQAKAWVFTGWLALGLAGGCWLAAALWMSSRIPRSIDEAFFAPSLAFFMQILFGSFLLSRTRWRSIVAALRDTLGEPTLALETDGSELQQRAVTRADLLNQSVLGSIFLLAVFIDAGTTTHGRCWATAGVVALVGLFTGGYMLASRRWWPLVDELRRFGPSQPRPSRPPEEAGE